MQLVLANRQIMMNQSCSSPEADLHYQIYRFTESPGLLSRASSHRPLDRDGVVLFSCRNRGYRTGIAFSRNAPARRARRMREAGLQVAGGRRRSTQYMVYRRVLRRTRAVSFSCRNPKYRAGIDYSRKAPRGGDGAILGQTSSPPARSHPTRLSCYS
jgi:hypothetical protein